MIRTSVNLAVSSIRGSKIRTLLTVVAVIIGVASFTVVTTTVDGLKNAAANEITGLGNNLIQVIPGNVVVEKEDGTKELNFIASFGSSTITNKDIADIKELDEVESIAPLGLVGAQVSRNDQVLKNATVIATSSDYPNVFSQKIEDGTFLSDDLPAGSRFVVVGRGVVDEFYGGELSLGTKITIRGESFTVLGSMEKYDSALAFSGGPDLNKAVYISIEHAQELSGGVVSISRVDMQLKSNVDTDDFKQKITDLLLNNHGGEKDFTILTQEELIELTDTIFGAIKQVGQFLSYIMLFVSSIVILLIMLISVKERTHEIGIRKSIGATNGNILVQFLTEAVLISWVGSFIGILLGLIGGMLIKSSTGITPAYSVETLITLVAISTTVGVSAGVTPAWIAARKNPVEAIRHE